MGITKLACALGFATSIVSAQVRRVPTVFVEFSGSIPPAHFHSCSGVEIEAKTLARDITFDIYVVELYSSDQHGLISPFLMDAGGVLPQAQGWIDSYRVQGPPPGAILFSVDGKYAFRCRDEQRHVVESSGAGGDPLQLVIPGGKAEISYFSITPEGMAHVFIITDRALDGINGEDLMAQVKQRLHTHYSFIYVRNDPWFLGYSGSSGPYIFSDQFKTITRDKYLNTKTMYCETSTGCKLSLSAEW